MQFFVYLLYSTVLKINDITNWIDEYTQNIPLKLLYISFETFKFEYTPDNVQYRTNFFLLYPDP